jgi:minor extracellular serine protease Vpr
MQTDWLISRGTFKLTVVAVIAAAGFAFGLPAAATPNDDASPTQASQDTGSALVQLNGDPLSTYVKTKPARGKKIDFNSNTVKSYRAQLSALRNDYKAWLRANVPQAKVTAEFDISLNAVAVQLNGATLAQLAAAPQVKHVEYEGLYRPTVSDPDLAIIKAKQAWAAVGTNGKGDGVKIAIVDTGIDTTHPCFSDAGYSAQTQLGDHHFTNNKVIAARVFNNKTPSQKYTAEALQEHGTHVAGTAACNENTSAPVDGVTTYDMSGVAPRALLGNYNVFPGEVANARSEDIMNALEAAYADGFDVANMSLGGTPGKSGQLGFQDLLTIAVDNLDEANMVIAVAAGNSGPGHHTIESPGSAARALTAGASTVGHFIGAPVTVGGNTYAGAIGDFSTVTTDLTAPLAVPAAAATNTNNLNDACSAFPAGSLAGAIALVTRGTCTFSTKIRNAQDAGAVAVLVGNNVFGDPTALGQDGTANQPTIPAYMVSRIDAGALKAFDTQSTTIGAALTYLQTANDDFMAGFSSQGPTDVDFRVKPDVVAPGVSVLSSIPHQFCDAPPAVGCFAFFQGTSMATPHLAGSAAVVRGAHPTWTAAQVRSAVVNTADTGVLKSATSGNPVSDVNLIGSGRENLLSAVGVGAALDPVSVSFGAVPSGSGQTLTFDVTVTNLSASAATWSVAVGAAGAGVAYSASPSSVSLAAGASTVVTVTMTAAKGAAAGDHQATLTVGGSHGSVYTFIK